MGSAKGGKGGGQLVQVFVSSSLKGLQDGQCVSEEDDIGGGIGALLDVGSTCTASNCFSLEVGGLQSCCEGNIFLFSSSVPDVNSSPTISDCFFSKVNKGVFTMTV